MRIAKRFTAFALCAAFILGAAFPSRAADTPKEVKIELEADTDDTRTYVPGEGIPYTLTVHNRLGPAWVRVQIDCAQHHFTGSFSDADVSLPNGWIRRGGYWYLTVPVSAYADVPAVTGITVPAAEKVDASDATITIGATADAVQADAITPDFSKDDPWQNADADAHAHASSGQKGNSSGDRRDVTGAIYTYTSPQTGARESAGRWVCVDSAAHIWRYTDGRGNYAKSGWIYVSNPYSPDGKTARDWFHFGDDGVMTYGWYRTDDGIWYYTHDVSDGNLGRLARGWHCDGQDGRWYYLDRTTGVMVSGWQTIDGADYYFATARDVPAQTWFWTTPIGQWIYKLLGRRSYGSMYAGERTPDGTYVGEDGRRIEQQS